MLLGPAHGRDGVDELRGGLDLGREEQALVRRGLVVQRRERDGVGVVGGEQDGVDAGGRGRVGGGLGLQWGGEGIVSSMKRAGDVRVARSRYWEGWRMSGGDGRGAS